MSHRAWTRVALAFAVVTGAAAPFAAGGSAGNGVLAAVLCTFWTAVWLRRRAKEDATAREGRG